MPFSLIMTAIPLRAPDPKAGAPIQFEMYYSDGGHGGPYLDFFMACEEAKRRIAGCRTTDAIEIRPSSSSARGGYRDGNKGSIFVRKVGVNWTISF